MNVNADEVFRDDRAVLVNKPKPEPSPVVRAFGGATVGFECPQCGAIHRVFPHLGAAIDQAQALAQARVCCGPYHCEKHGIDLGRSSWCRQCSKEREVEVEANQYEAATKVSLAEYGVDYLFREGFGREGFFSSADVRDMQSIGKCPEWAFACDPFGVSEEDCNLQEHVQECILVDFHEGADDEVDPVKIAQASKLLFEACADVKSYEPDHTVVVLLKGIAE